MGAIFDYLNRPILTSKKPDTREVAAVSIRDRWSGYPSAGLTPVRLAAIFRAADWGSLRDQAEMFEEMEEKDAHLFSVMQTRRLAVVGLDWDLFPASESRADRKIADFCRESLENLALEDLLAHLLGAVGHGYAAAEILWDAGIVTAVKGFTLIHPKNVSFENSISPLIITESDYQGVELPPFKMVYHRYAARSGHDTRNGVLRVCAYMYLFKNYALKDWAAFNEIFGMPLRLGKYEPSATPSDREALRQAIINLGSDAAGIISKSTEIEFVEAPGRLSGLSNPYQVMAFFCNREISKAVLGQTLTTDTEGSTGTYAAGRVQEEVRKDLLEADAQALAKTVRLQILRPLVGFNFGWNAPLPRFQFLLKEEEDLKALSEQYQNLIESGVPIPAAHIYERFGIPAPEKGEAVIGLPAASRQPPGEDKTKNGQVAAKAVLSYRSAGRDARPTELELIPQDRRVIEVQGHLENLSQAALNASAQAAAKMLAPVQELIESGKSLEEIRDGLLAAFPHMADQAGDLAEMLHQARMLAYMKGRIGE